MDRHVSDEYVKQAQALAYRSRAAFKLLEIQKKDHILHADMRIVDLGAAPGGWSQVAAKIVGERGMVVALDILAIDPMPGVDIIQGDFREDEPLRQLTELLQGHPVDLVLSDMAPNISGIKSVDQSRAMYLCELALAFARGALKPGGHLVVKVFQGEGFDEFLRELRTVFARVTVRKPKASRPSSREVYVVARNFKL